MSKKSQTELAQMSEGELERLAFHNISVARLGKLCDPFCAWRELESPITRQEVLDCLARGEEKLCETPLWTTWESAPENSMPAHQVRANHIAKIAYFVRHPIKEPISIDVGVPSMGHHTSHLLEDGNHRLAGAIIAGRRFIPAQVGGEVAHAKSLGLWKPNRYQAELDRRWEEQLRAKSSPRP